MQRSFLLLLLAAIGHYTLAGTGDVTEPQLESRDSKLIESVGLETVGGVFTPLIPQNAKLGTSVSQVFSTFSDDQNQITLHLFAGTAPLAAENRALGTYVVTGFPAAPRGTPQVEIQFTATRDSKLAITAKDSATGKSLHIQRQ
jgi:molecular chaperone DnaK